MCGRPVFKRPESVLVVVYTEAGDVLLLKRTDHPEFWQSVTGSLAWGESPARAARRELKEETGLRADALVDHHRTFEFEILERWRHRFEPGIKRNLEHLFSVRLRGRMPVKLDPEEHSAQVWLGREAAAAKVWSWTNRDAILSVVPEARS